MLDSFLKSQSLIFIFSLFFMSAASAQPLSGTPRINSMTDLRECQQIVKQDSSPDKAHSMRACLQEKSRDNKIEEAIKAKRAQSTQRKDHEEVKREQIMRKCRVEVKAKKVATPAESQAVLACLKTNGYQPG